MAATTTRTMRSELPDGDRELGRHPAEVGLPGGHAPEEEPDRPQGRARGAPRPRWPRWWPGGRLRPGPACSRPDRGPPGRGGPRRRGWRERARGRRRSTRRRRRPGGRRARPARRWRARPATPSGLTSSTPRSRSAGARACRSWSVASTPRSRSPIFRRSRKATRPERTRRETWKTSSAMRALRRSTRSARSTSAAAARDSSSMPGSAGGGDVLGPELEDQHLADVDRRGVALHLDHRTAGGARLQGVGEGLAGGAGASLGRDAAVAAHAG